MPYADKNKERECVKRYKREHKDEINARTRELRKLDPERFRAHTKKYRLSLSPETRRRRRRASYLGRKERELKKNREWSKAHPECYRKSHRKWNAKNPARCSHHRNIRRARLQNATIGNTDVIEQWEKIWRAIPRARCYWCQSIFQSTRCVIDHIIPLARGGSHAVENLCISCKLCNLKKHVLSISQWSASLSEPVLF